MWVGGLAGGVRIRIYLLRGVYEVMPVNSSLAELVIGNKITQVRIGRRNVFTTCKNKSRKQLKFYESKKFFVRHENF